MSILDRFIFMLVWSFFTYLIFAFIYGSMDPYSLAWGYDHGEWGRTSWAFFGPLIGFFVSMSLGTGDKP